MKVTINEFYEDRTGEYITTKYLVDGEPITEEEYDSLMETLDEININNICEDEVCEFGEFECDECKFNDEVDQCDCPDCTLDRYSQILSEMTGGCIGCIRDVLESFLSTVIDHIVIEDIEEDMVEEDRPLN